MTLATSPVARSWIQAARKPGPPATARARSVVSSGVERDPGAAARALGGSSQAPRAVLVARIAAPAGKRTRRFTRPVPEMEKRARPPLTGTV